MNKYDRFAERVIEGMRDWPLFQENRVAIGKYLERHPPPFDEMWAVQLAAERAYDAVVMGDDDMLSGDTSDSS